MPTPTPITTCSGKTISAVGLVDDTLIVRYSDNEFSIVSIYWERDEDDPILYEPLTFSLSRHGQKAVATGVISQAALNQLLADRDAQRQAQLEAREYATYLKLKAKYE